MRECVICGALLDYEPRSGRPPVTCSPDCHRIRKNQKSEESRQRAVSRGCPDDMHGTSTGYSHYKCHCPQCTKWARLYKQERRKALKH